MNLGGAAHSSCEKKGFSELGEMIKVRNIWKPIDQRGDDHDPSGVTRKIETVLWNCMEKTFERKRIALRV